MIVGRLRQRNSLVEGGGGRKDCECEWVSAAVSAGVSAVCVAVGGWVGWWVVAWLHHSKTQCQARLAHGGISSITTPKKGMNSTNKELCISYLSMHNFHKKKYETNKRFK